MCGLNWQPSGYLIPDKFAYGRAGGVGRARGTGVGLGVGGGAGVPNGGVGVAVGEGHGVPCPWHQVMWRLSTRQPSLPPLVSLAIRQRSLPCV